MRSILKVLGLVAVAGAATHQTAPVKAREARSHIGKSVTVADSVAEKVREAQSGLTFLNFGAPFPDHVFRAVIPDSVASRLDASLLEATMVRIAGMVRAGPGGIPEILCETPAQVLPFSNTAVPVPAATPPATTRRCCRVCSTGKPCGNSCIARTSTCRQPPGCACAP